MKSCKVLAVCILVFVIIVSLAACGGNSSASGETQTTVALDTSPQEASVEQAIDAPDTKASADALVGEWVDINSPERFAKITKTDAGFDYEDNEGKMTGTFANGVLKVNVPAGGTADVYISTKTGNLTTIYQDNVSEFKKK